MTSNSPKPDDAIAVREGVESVSDVRSQEDIIAGRMFSTGYLFEDVTAGSTVGILLENPSDSGKVVFVSGTFRAEGKLYVRKTDSVTVDTAGTQLTIQNRRIDDGVSECSVERGASVSGGNPWSRKVLGGGTGGGTLAPSESTEYGIILTPGDNVYYEAENASSSTEDISIDVDYDEIDADELPRL